MICQQKNPPQLHIIHQKTLLVLIPQVIHLAYYQMRLPQLQIMNQVNLLVEIPHHSHLISHQRILSTFHNLSPVILPVLICQDCHLQSHISYNWRIVSHLHLLLPLPPPFRSPKFFHQHSLLIILEWNLSHFQLLHQVLLPVTFPVKTPQVCFCQQLRQTTLHHQKLLFYQLLFLLNFTVDQHLQALHPQVFHH